jgi:CPA1 family monovalent cation:H+ antiporter
MNISQTILMFMAMLLAALLAEPLAHRLRLPLGATLVAIGFVGSTALTARGIDTGLRWDSFEPLITNVFIPVLVFQAAIEIDPRRLWRDVVPILVLAMPVMTVAAALIAVIVYHAIGHPAGFPWIAAWLTGILLASTDPGPAVGLLRAHPAGERVALLLDGESLFNDALAIALYATLLPLALMPSMQGVSWVAVVMQTAMAFFGGLAVGAAVGWCARALLRYFRRSVEQGVITWVAAYTSFVVTDSVLGWSGVMAVLACGLILGEWWRQAETPAAFVQEIWSFAAYVAGGVLFLLAGVTITATMFREQWLAMLIGIAAVLLSRAVSVPGGLSLLRLWPTLPCISGREQLLVAAGGTRGVVALALALSLPLELDYWLTVQSLVYGVVLFTLTVQVLLMSLLLRQPASRRLPG